MQALLHLVGALHARGFHPAVLAGLIMMPTVVAVGCLTDRAGFGRPEPAVAAAIDLRGSFDDLPNTKGPSLGF